MLYVDTLLKRGILLVTGMIELLSDLSIADMNDRLPNYLKKLDKIDVLVIDDFLLTSTNELEKNYSMELELRCCSHSLVLSSQMEIGEWHKKLGGGAIADAILDRAISNSYHIYIAGDSMRQEARSVLSD